MCGSEEDRLDQLQRRIDQQEEEQSNDSSDDSSDDTNMDTGSPPLQETPRAEGRGRGKGRGGRRGGRRGIVLWQGARSTSVTYDIHVYIYLHHFYTTFCSIFTQELKIIQLTWKPSYL